VGDALSPWEYATWSYVAFALLTLWWPLSAALRGVKLNPGGSSFSESDWFSDQAKKYLVEHHGRLQGTLGFWKKQAETYRRFHYYVLLWTIPVSALILVLTQSISDDRWSRVLLTIASAHVAVLLAMHKAFKVDATWRGYRHGESEFYDTYRRLLDRPRTFGATETEQLDTYFDDVENIRKFTRNAETDNLPTLERAQQQLRRDRAASDDDSPR
jgi:hypothetical protein